MSSHLPSECNCGFVLSGGGKHATLRGCCGPKLLGFSIGGPTDERHPFTKIRETSLGWTADSTALISGVRQV